MRDIDILGDDGTTGNVGTGEKLEDTGSQQLEHERVEPLQGPAGRQAGTDCGIDLVLPGDDPGNDPVEEVGLRGGYLLPVEIAVEPVRMKFVEKP